MSKRAIVVFPKFEEIHLIHQLRSQFDPLVHTLEPHITLVFPFESNLSTKHLQSHIEQAVQGIGPFPVQFHGITGSEGEYLFLNVERGNDQLIELHDRLYSGALAVHLSVEHTFIPHLTVGRLKNKAAFLSALEEVRKVSPVFQTVIAEVAVFQVKGRAFGSPLARGFYPRASTAEVDPRAKPGAPAAVDGDSPIEFGVRL